jgi:hypothetical protein
MALWAVTARAETITTPHVATGGPSHAVTLAGDRYVDDGLVGAGRLPAATVDFLGDTLGSFSSLAIDRGSWRRVGDHYEGTMWTLPDRGRNDPGANLFFDYPGRLNRFRIRFKPYVGKNLPASKASQKQFVLVQDGGLELRDFNGQPFTGADPDIGTVTQRGFVLPSPARGTGAGKVSLDAESLQFTADGHFYIGDEYAANVYYFGADGQLQGILVPPPAVVPRSDGHVDFRSLVPPQTGRRNNQGVEGMSLSPDGTRLFVALQSALIQDSATGHANGRVDTRVLVYDVSHDATPAQPVAHYVIQLPAYRKLGDGQPADATAAQSELRALDGHRFLMLARDANGLGTDNDNPIVYKSVLLADTAGATNLAGTAYERSTQSLLAALDDTRLKPGITPIAYTELVNMVDPAALARIGMTTATTPKNAPLTLSEKWEAMDVLPALDVAHPHDYFLIVGNDNDFIARRCVMSGQTCDSSFDNDSMILVYRLTLPR